MERQKDDGNQETATATQRLSFAKHFHVVIGTFLILAVVTVIIILAFAAIPETADKVASALRSAGAHQTIITTVI